jgi:pimeloyl-ACP methyl ester carboxylesterase
MSETIRYDRRRFIGTAVMATAGAGLVGSRLREPESRDEFSLAATMPRTNEPPGRIKNVDGGDRKLGYAEAGPSNGPPAILLNGCPDGIDNDVAVAQLAAAGHRVIVPYVRGNGTRRFASSDRKRNGAQTLGAAEVMALMDALNIEKALVGGLDADAQTAEVMAALWPMRVKGIAPASGCLVINLVANQRPLPPKEELGWWYQYYFGREGLR